MEIEELTSVEFRSANCLRRKAEELEFEQITGLDVGGICGGR